MGYAIALAGSLLLPTAKLERQGYAPVVLGMTQAEVERRLGPPQNGYERLGNALNPTITALYFTPRLEVVYQQGRVTALLLSGRPWGHGPQP